MFASNFANFHDDIFITTFQKNNFLAKIIIKTCMPVFIDLVAIFISEIKMLSHFSLPLAFRKLISVLF